MRISDWSSDVCSSDLSNVSRVRRSIDLHHCEKAEPLCRGRRKMWGSWISRLLAAAAVALSMSCGQVAAQEGGGSDSIVVTLPADLDAAERRALIDALAALGRPRSEEHTSELQYLMRISYAVFCWT